MTNVLAPSPLSTSSKKRKIHDHKSSDSKTGWKKPRSQQELPTSSQAQLFSAAENEASQMDDNANAKTFGELSLPDGLQKAISGLGVSELSPLQTKLVSALVSGRDVFAVADSGRDAMLSFLVPAVALLQKHRFHTRHGTGVLVVTPNRETAVQVSGLASELLAGTTHTVGMTIEGANRGAEEQKLERGVNLLVATPIRLLEHIRDDPSFVIKNLRALFVYGTFLETDKQRIGDIINQIPKKGRISGVITPEKTDEVEGLNELVCRPESVQRYVEAGSTAVDTQHVQGYVVVEADTRFLLLYSFLRKFQKKIVVVLSSTSGVLFCSEACGRFDLGVHAIHGRQNVKSRTAAFSEFVKDAEGTLICTEEAVQGFEVPSVDWVIHYDPPWSIKEAIRRRRAIKGRLLAFVQPCERGFIDELKAASVAVEEFDFPKKKLMNIQSQLEKLVSKDFELHNVAKDGFRSFLQDYNRHVDNKIFDVTKLDVRKVAKSFGFDTPPRVEMKAEERVVVDKNCRVYGPEKLKSGKKRKAQ